MDPNRRNLLIGGAIVAALAAGGLLPSACAMRRITSKPAMPMSNAPKRPKGEPKPMLEEDIAPVLARLDAWYAANLPADKYAFNPPATDAQLDDGLETETIFLGGRHTQLPAFRAEYKPALATRKVLAGARKYPFSPAVKFQRFATMSGRAVRQPIFTRRGTASRNDA